MIAILDYTSNDGKVLIEAGQFVSDDLATALSPDGLAKDEVEAQDKLRDVARRTLADGQAASNPVEYHRIMFGYHRSLALMHEAAYRKKLQEISHAANHIDRSSVS